MAITVRKAISATLTVLVIALIFFSASFSINVQGSTSITPADRFDIPNCNATINFAFSGTYETKSFQNNAWTFTNLHLAESDPMENLTVSAKNSNVTIVSFRALNLVTFRDRIQYNVSGVGEQTLNLVRKYASDDWEVRIDKDYKAKGYGWSVSPDKTLTITGAVHNVSIYFYTYQNSTGSGNGSFYEQHSVAIVTALAVGTTVIIAVVLKTVGRRGDES